MRTVGWDDLPNSVRREVEARIGPVDDVHVRGGGLNHELGAVLRTARGTAFVKGMRTSDWRLAGQLREARMNPHLVGIAPRLLCHVRTGGWSVLAFEYVAGPNADLTPGSPNLPKVARVLQRLSRLRCPGGLVLRRIEDRWCEYGEASELAALSGDTLLHTDLNPGNVLVTDEAYLVDWAWPARGASWIDTGCALLWLITAGHTPAQAIEWAQQVPAWRDADPAQLRVFAEVQRMMWAEIALDRLQQWTVRHAVAANALADHVMVTYGSEMRR